MKIPSRIRYSRWKSSLIFVLFFQLGSFSLMSQDVGDPEIVLVKSREWNLSFFVNTRGVGVGYQVGKLPDYRNRHAFETDFLYSRHPKQLRVSSGYWEGSRPFSYGKMCDLFFWRVGYAYQHVLHHKPYWGGVEVRYSLSAGFTLGIGFPSYLKILYIAYPSMNYVIMEEQYNPEIHNTGNIVGASDWYAPFKGIFFRPGGYLKTGISFDFSKSQYKLHVLEVGLSADSVFPFIQQMAFNKATPIYLNAYIAYSFGRKKGLYE